MKILILDDNRDALLVLESFLKALDHNVHAYDDATEALLWLKDIKPEVIIADLDMPGMDGFTFVKKVRAYHAYAETPIICITGTSATSEEIGASGFSAILRKPTTLSDVMTALDNVVTAKAEVIPVETQPEPVPPADDSVAAEPDIVPPAPPTLAEAATAE